MNDGNGKTPFYKKDWFLYLSLIILPLFGIAVMWHFRKDMNKSKKASLTLIFAIWFLLIPLAGGNFDSGADGAKAVSPNIAIAAKTAPAVTSESQRTEMTTTELIVTSAIDTALETSAEEVTTSNKTESVKDSCETGSGEYSSAQNDDERREDSEHYVLNTNTKKFHHYYCSSVKTIHAENYEDFHGAREEAIARGYEPCGRCHP